MFKLNKKQANFIKYRTVKLASNYRDRSIIKASAEELIELGFKIKRCEFRGVINGLNFDHVIHDEDLTT